MSAALCRTNSSGQRNFPPCTTPRSSISCAATAASRCSTVWIVAAPWPIAVRRSTASTSVSRAGTSGLPARSVRRKTIPCPAGAGRNVASVVAPVCSPVPRSAAGRVTERLALGDGRRRLSCGGGRGLGLNESLEIVHDFGETVERHLGAQKLAVRACRRPEVGSLGGNIGDRPGLDEQPGAACDAEMIRDARLPRDDHVVLHLHAPGDAG